MKILVLRFVLCFGFFLSSVGVQAEVYGELSDELDGLSITYHYASGRQYDVEFSDGMLSYLRKDVAGREWERGHSYIARKIEENLYLMTWGREERTEYITILIDLKNNVLYTSALLEGTERHFDEADIIAVSRR